MHFVGEQGIDTGGLSREFWRLLCDNIVKDYCIGESGKCIFVRNVPALQVREKLCGYHVIIMCIMLFRVVILSSLES